MYIYEAGNLTYFYETGNKELAKNWRIQLSEFCIDNYIDYFDPSLTFDNKENHKMSYKTIVKQNDYYLNKADIMVVQLDGIEKSPGTLYEVYKFHRDGKPVIGFGANRPKSPHISVCIDEFCESIDDVIQVLLNMYNQTNF